MSMEIAKEGLVKTSSIFDFQFGGCHISLVLTLCRVFYGCKKQTRFLGIESLMKGGRNGIEKR